MTTNRTTPRRHFSDGSVELPLISYDRDLVADCYVILGINNDRHHRTASDHTTPRRHFSDESVGIAWISYDLNVVADYDLILEVNT